MKSGQADLAAHRLEGRAGHLAHRGVEWVYEYDEGVDPDDPAVRDLARATLEAMRLEVGLP